MLLSPVISSGIQIFSSKDYLQPNSPLFTAGDLSNFFRENPKLQELLQHFIQRIFLPFSLTFHEGFLKTLQWNLQTLTQGGIPVNNISSNSSDSSYISLGILSNVFRGISIENPAGYNSKIRLILSSIILARVQEFIFQESLFIRDD